jgi:hypothetical protein
MTKAETIRTAKLGKKDLRLVRKDGRFFGLVEGEVCVEGESADDVWRRLHDEAGKADPKYFGFNGAPNRFLHWFAGGFQSPNYFSKERAYKIDAKEALDATVPLEKAATGSGYGPALLSRFHINLLSPYEQIWIRDVLRASEADEFVRAAARFTLGDGKPALLAMERALKAHRAAKWTIVTLLPFLWRPEQHMFLKPEATKDFATRVGHRFASDHEPRLNLSVYESLLDLASKTDAELADLRPRDRIDVQSFIWVVGDYREGRETPKP